MLYVILGRREGGREGGRAWHHASRPPPPVTVTQVKLYQAEIANLSPFPSSRLAWRDESGEMFKFKVDNKHSNLCRSVLALHSTHHHMTWQQSYTTPTAKIRIMTITVIIITHHSPLCWRRGGKSSVRAGKISWCQRPQNNQSSFQSLIAYWVLVTTITTARQILTVTSVWPPHTTGSLVWRQRTLFSFWLTIITY